MKIYKCHETLTLEASVFAGQNIHPKKWTRINRNICTISILEDDIYLLCHLLKHSRPNLPVINLISAVTASFSRSWLYNIFLSPDLIITIQ